jgi:CheY-like chemotaxis protein
VGDELSNARVLIVEDDRDVREIMKVILDAHGAHTAVAANAAEGLSVLRTFLPELLLSDISLPDEDGYDFLRRVRALPVNEGGNTPAVAVSGHVYTADREQAFNAGFQAFIAKPVNPGSLVECVKGFVERGRTDTERRRAPRRGTELQSGITSERRMCERRQPVC